MPWGRHRLDSGNMGRWHYFTEGKRVLCSTQESRYWGDWDQIIHRLPDGEPKDELKALCSDCRDRVAKCHFITSKGMTDKEAWHKVSLVKRDRVLLYTILKGVTEKGLDARQILINAGNLVDQGEREFFTAKGKLEQG